MHAAITGIGMVPGERDNDQVIVREPERDFPDVYNRVLGVPEVLLPILRYVVLGEGTRGNILRIASVSHLWREVVCDILQHNGVPVYQFNAENQAMADWAEYFVPGKITLGYLFPVGLQVTDSKLLQAGMRQIIRANSERVIQLKLIVYKSDLRLLHILESFKFSNLHSLKLSFPNCRQIWPEDSVRIVQSVMKAAPKLKNLSLDWNYPYHNIPYSPVSRWYQKTLNTKLESRLVAECSDWRLEKLRLSILGMAWNSVCEWILKLSAPTIRKLDIVYGTFTNRRLILLPDTLVFPNLKSLRLEHVVRVNGTVPFDLLRRFPSLKYVHISNDDFHPTTLSVFDQFFPESMPISPMVQVFNYKGEDVLESQCSRLIKCMPNCIKLVLDWQNAYCANNCLRQITRNMTHLKILEVYLSAHYPHKIAERIDDWTFAGVESSPEAPRLEQIKIYARYPEKMSRSIAIYLPIRIPTLRSLEILEHHFQEPGSGRDVTPYFSWCR